MEFIQNMSVMNVASDSPYTIVAADHLEHNGTTNQ